MKRKECHVTPVLRGNGYLHVAAMALNQLCKIGPYEGRAKLWCLTLQRSPTFNLTFGQGVSRDRGDFHG
jgi:hypothetical protein